MTTSQATRKQSGKNKEMIDLAQAIKPATEFDTQIAREWLLANGRGSYASGTVLGLPTRRYHGLLIAAARPPLERWLLLAGTLERISVGNHAWEVPGYQFEGAIHPHGYQYQTHFAYSTEPHQPWAWFKYVNGQISLTKQILMPHGRDEVYLRYRLEGPPQKELSLEISPFVAMRDFHSVTHAFDPGYTIIPGGEHTIAVEAFAGGPRVWMEARQCLDSHPVPFDREPHWWYGFVYREEQARGLDDREDLYAPGWFRATGKNVLEIELRAAADFSGGQADVPVFPEPQPPAEPKGPRLSVEDRLRQAADSFVVVRQRPNQSDLTTILAGYHWFGDWGRDTFIALPGLLLETGRYEEARQVLEVFASAQQDGLIPNRFADYGEGRDYNSVDASLWYLHAADEYVRVSGDRETWERILEPCCRKIVESFVAGTLFNIQLDEDGLISCGDENTQLTWMDAKCGNEAFTPRQGKPVEINALWYHGLCALAERCRADNPEQAGQYIQLAERCRASFVNSFWNESGKYLYDVIRGEWKDMAIRPNQIFAVSLPHSPLDEEKQRFVLACVERELFTPYGLRSLARNHPAYAGRYQGGPYARDSVYHQGTVWGWLIGPYVEAFMRVNNYSSTAKKHMRKQLQPLVDHLETGGLGTLNEIFDGDPPHTPRGTISQAWSVSELLRAWRMTE